MKKLIFFSKHMEIGGLEKSLLNLLNSLDPTKYSVDLVLEEMHGPLLDQLGSHITVKEYKLSDCKFIPLRKVLNLTKRMLWRAKYRNHYDFSCSYCTYSIIGSRLAQYASPNSCLYVHNNYTTIYPDYNEFVKFFGELRTNLFRKVLFVSNESRESFLEWLPQYEDKCDVVNNLVDWQRVRQLAEEPCSVKKQDNETMFVFVGRLDEPHKRLSRLLEAFAKARKVRSDLRLVIVGDGPDRSLCEELIKQHGISDTVTMVGSQKNPYPYLNAADCLVLSSDYEGFPVVYFEAMILGKDIITTIPVSDERIDIGTYATVADKTPDSFADALINYRVRENEPLNMEQLNHQRLEKFCRLFSQEI